MVSRTSVYQSRIRTDSADGNALLLLAGGELVAILVALDDAAHGEDRHKWTIETIFGIGHKRAPDTFACAADAAAWVSKHICHLPFVLGGPLGRIG